MTLAIEPVPPAVEEKFIPGSPRLYIFFGGLQGRLGMAAFEFMRSAEILDCSSIFLRDPYRAWYQRGLPDIAQDVHGLARFLEGRIAASGATEVRFVGNCMGGFAAILLCSLLQRGKAIAFAPQTLIGPGMMELHPGEPVLQAYTGMYAHRTESHIYDLPLWLKTHTPDIHADIYAPGAYAIDVAHAETLRGFRNIGIHYVNIEGHGVTRHLREQGRLKEILTS